MINAAIIGLGWWGRTLTGSLAGSEHIRVSTGVDPDPAGRRAGRELGLQMADSLEAVLEDPAIDAVLLCTPHRLHADQVVTVSGAGKHVFCEKPFTDDLVAADRALDAVARAGVVVGIGHERRFEPSVLQLHRDARAGRLGDLIAFEGNFSQDKFLALPRDNWRLSPVLAPVGPLSATGIHLMDLAVSFFGRPEKVWARLSNDFVGFGNGDALSVLLQFPGGRTATLNAILATPFIGRIALFGTNGWCEIRDRTHPEAPTGWDVLTTIRGEDPSTEFAAPYAAHRANVEAFAIAADGGTPYPVGHEDIRSNVATFAAIVASALSGQVEKVG